MSSDSTPSRELSQGWVMLCSDPNIGDLPATARSSWPRSTNILVMGRIVMWTAPRIMPLHKAGQTPTGWLSLDGARAAL